MLSSIRTWGNSQGIYIPKKLLKEANLELNDTVEIIASGSSLVITKDDSNASKKNAFESLKALRKELTSHSNLRDRDYEKELEEYFDEKYGK